MQHHVGNGSWCPARDIGSVGIETARIQRVDQHAGANGAVHDVGLFRRVLRQGHKPAGDQDDGALPRHGGHAADQFLDHAHGEARLMIAEIQFLLRGLLGHLRAPLPYREVGAVHGHPRRGIQHDGVVLVHDQVRHVIGHVGAVR
jgi:hypothetical protein